MRFHFELEIDAPDRKSVSLILAHLSESVLIEENQNFGRFLKDCEGEYSGGLSENLDVPCDINESIHNWYIRKYHDFAFGQYIKRTLTFKDAYEALGSGAKWYSIVGAHSALVMDRIFRALAYLYHCKVSTIYQKNWKL